MTWTIISIILISLLKILVTCLPTGTVEWLMKKFETHSKLNVENITLTIDGKQLEVEDKIKVINDFNEAIFTKKHYIFPGTEDAFLSPEDSETPIVIDTKIGKRDVRLLLYRYNDRVDVVKKYKKKLVAYSLLSENLQKLS
ncbi:YfmQ family protein [Neobacillus drentensis]|uniref:YfmQ family protein n=1 Tax=Neobacillus drentensis TaxID=220684 RepID=UPI001F42DE4A|nr:YfmQ family protein [Neobacillus drentensis]ULT58249.1 YfmQ family protein [Neobacillus drentensis]